MKYTEQTVESIIKSLKEGAGRVNACRHAGVHYDTFLDWMNNKPEFSEKILKAENEKNECIKQTCVQRILEASANDWRAGAWLIERKFPNEYGKRIELTDKSREWAKAFELVGDDNGETT